VNEKSLKNLRKFKKGEVHNPNGRPKVILPELQKVIDGNRNSVKLMIIQKLDSTFETWLDNIIKQGCTYGDVNTLKMLLEMALGKMVEDPPDFPVNEEEKLLILEFRRRKKEQDERDNTPAVKLPE